MHLSGDASIKGNLATAFRAPNATELYFPGYGVPTLQPERAKVADLTLVDSHLLGGASLGWFANRTNGLIQYNLNSFVLDQIDHAFVEGFTFDLRAPRFHGISTALDITDLYRAQNIDTGSRLANDPVLATNLCAVEYAGGNAPTIVDALGFSMRLEGARQIRRSLGAAIRPAYRVLDAGRVRAPARRARDAALAARVQSGQRTVRRNRRISDAGPLVCDRGLDEIT